MIPLALRLVEITPEGQAHALPVMPIEDAEPVDRNASAQELAETYERGRLAGNQEEQEAFAAMLEQDRQHFAQQLQAQRDEWISSQAELMAQQLTAAAAAIEMRLADSVAKILEPFVEAALRQKAVEEFCATIKGALQDNAEALLVVTGPQDLLDAIATKLETSLVTIDYVASDTCAVSAKLGATIFETQLTHWLSALRGSAP